MLSNMESNSRMTPGEARDALSVAATASSRMAAGLRLPSRFHVWLGTAIAFQIATAAWAMSRGADDGAALGVLAAGVVVFLVVAADQVRRFRKLNGATVDGLVSRVVLGTSFWSSAAYTAGLGLAVWAGLADLAWLIWPTAAVAGVGYALAGRHWWSRYQADPTAKARAESRLELAALVLLAVLGLVVLLVASR